MIISWVIMKLRLLRIDVSFSKGSKIKTFVKPLFNYKINVYVKIRPIYKFISTL